MRPQARQDRGEYMDCFVRNNMSSYEVRICGSHVGTHLGSKEEEEEEEEEQTCKVWRN